ncbi:hypothetical protein EVA_15485 [gut metagenome]|uniref:Uncharacterized protein n=1 Tax=gut metagenome TaxID=749906 RepID=J9GAF1_9ZZZZ
MPACWQMPSAASILCGIKKLTRMPASKRLWSLPR